MALVLAADNVLTVRLNYSNSTEGTVIAFNILHYKVGSTVGAPPAMSVILAAIGQDMFNKWSVLWKTAAGPDTQMNSVTVTNVFPLPRSVSYTYVPGAPVVGDQAGDSLPLQDAPTLLKKTEVGNRWGQGRLYYVGLSESVADSGVVEASGQTLLNTMASHLSDTVTTTSGGFSCNLLPVLLRGPEDNPTSLTQITSGRLSDKVIKSQRRRRPGKGI